MRFRSIYTFLAIIFLAGILHGCCKKRIYCIPGSMQIVFQGFSQSKLRNIWLKRYKIETFGKALDSAQFLYNGSSIAHQNGRDTLSFSDYYTIGDLNGVQEGNDWAVFIPATGQTFIISQILDEEHKYDIGACGSNESCTNNIAHFSLNGRWNDGNTAYIQP